MATPFEYDAPLKLVLAEGSNSYFIDQNNVLNGWGQEFGNVPSALLEDVVDFKANVGQYLALNRMVLFGSGEKTGIFLHILM